jgi:hypothetical protein
VPTLLEEICPLGSLRATIEDDGRTVYLYVASREGHPFGMRAAWIRNRVAAPDRFDPDELKAGRAPLLPRDACAHPDGAPALSGSLRLLWFEECDGVALYENDVLLAVLPSWADAMGCGYARDCMQDRLMAFPLDAARAELEPRLARAREFWRSWDEGDPWASRRDALVSSVERVLGRSSNYYAIDGGYWPPRALVRAPTDDGTVLVTCGMSILPMPTIEREIRDASPVRRIEIGLAVRNREFDEPGIQRLLRFVSGTSALPWKQLTWLGDHHTVSCDAIEGFPAVMCLRMPRGAPGLALPASYGDPVSVLWMVPITQSEYSFAIEHTSDELVSRFGAGGPPWMHCARSSVV